MPLVKGRSRRAFEENVETEEEAGKPRDQALAIAYSIRRRHKAAGGMVDGYAKGGQVENEKLHAAEHEPVGMRSAHDIVHMIMRKRQGAQPPEYMDEGGQVDDGLEVEHGAEGAPGPAEPSEARVRARAHERAPVAPAKPSPQARQQGRQKQIQANIVSGAYENAANRASGSKLYSDEVDRRMSERQQEDEALHSDPNYAYGGQVDDHPEGKTDFLTIAEHEGMEDGMVDPQERRKRRLRDIMSNLHAEHYGRK